jgi:hypothetical protein
MPVPIFARFSCALLALSTLLPAPAFARMYQWVDPGTGTVQLSGTPPPWYRGGPEAGPRVFVFEQGRLVDDTSRSVAEEQAQALRATAFGVAPTAPPATISPLEAPMFANPEPLPEAPPAAAEEGSTSARMAEFKALLEAYDANQGAAARDTLEDAARAVLPPDGISVPSP